MVGGQLAYNGQGLLLCWYLENVQPELKYSDAMTRPEKS
jgi:hypothetical protein